MGFIGLSSAAVATAGVVTALAYFAWRLVQERQFYKGKVCRSGSEVDIDTGTNTIVVYRHSRRPRMLIFPQSQAHRIIGSGVISN
jgi:hypothetical protein